MTIISAVVGHRHDIDPKYGLDPLLLTSEERASAHFVAKTVSGRSLRVSLPRGTDLQDGDILAIEGDWAVVVTAADEDLLLIQPGDDAIHWWAACYQLGNLHRPARFLDDGILTPADPMAMQILAGLGVKVERVRRPFVGRRFGSAEGVHHHGHDDDGHDHPHHENGHGHAHNADKAGA